MLEIKNGSVESVSFGLSNLYCVLMQGEEEAIFVLIRPLITHDKIMKAQLQYCLVVDKFGVSTTSYVNNY